MIDVFLGQRVDGIVVGSAAGTPSSWVHGGRTTAPLVLVDWDTPFNSATMNAAQDGPVPSTIRRIERQVRAVPYPHVATDDVDGTSRATRHLLDLGHRDIAFVGLQPIRPSLLRLLGVRRTLASEGLQPFDVIACAPTLEGGQEAGRRLMEAPRRPSAVIAFDDMVAVGIIRAVHLAGMSVPRDLSVIGFDDIEVAAFVEPPLTTVRQSKQALGSLALDVILAKPRGSAPAEQVFVPGELVIRQSVARPAGRTTEAAG
jgi:LacI family transcriptional regulator